MQRRMMLCAVLASVLVLPGCGDDNGGDPIITIFPAVVLEADVNLQVGNTIIGARPHYIMTTFLRATQGNESVAAGLDSVVLSYRLNDGPFVVGTALTQALYAGDMPFTVQTGDRYTLYARLYAHASGKGGRTAEATDDFNASGVAVAPQ